MLELSNAMSPTIDSAIPASIHQASRVVGQPTIRNSNAVVSGLDGTCNQTSRRSAEKTARTATTRTAMTGATEEIIDRPGALRQVGDRRPSSGALIDGAHNLGPCWLSTTTLAPNQTTDH